MRAPRRQAGYAPIGDYAAIGDGRTAALVARDGSIDWLCLPDLDSASVFGGLLDARRGGSFRLSPAEPFEAERRYLPGTNLLETTFRTASGSVVVTDAMPLPGSDLAPSRELTRTIRGLAGEVELRWRLEPRFEYGGRRPRLGRRAGVPVAEAGSEALAALSFGAGEPTVDAAGIGASARVGAGTEATLALAVASGEPLVLPRRREVERRGERTRAFWRRWSEDRAYEGPWREQVLRSALVLKLLIQARSGAIAAAVTTSLPEEIGGVRNWDYRYSWVRDSSATLDALLRLGCLPEVESFFWWLLHASQLTHPRVNVLYRLNGRADAEERRLDLEGYRGSAPARLGNAAAPQLQLDVYGHLLQTAWLYARAGGRFDADAAARLASTADLVARIWEREDAGIWEVRGRSRHFTESKMMCWIGLRRAAALAEAGSIPASGRERWLAAADRVRDFVSRRCWSDARRSYMRFPGAEETDASILLPLLMGYGEGDDARAAATVERIRAELGSGPLLYRYRGEDGLPGREGAFVACSFWLVDALARLGRVEEGAELMDELVGLGNDVGLFAEEIDPGSGEHLGNVPQGLVHLALINAAATLAEAGSR